MKLVVRRCSPDEVALGLASEASLVVCDRGYLRHQRRWRENVAQSAGREVVQVEEALEGLRGPHNRDLGRFQGSLEIDVLHKRGRLGGSELRDAICSVTRLTSRIV